jgi:hypothetical protein
MLVLPTHCIVFRLQTYVALGVGFGLIDTLDALIDDPLSLIDEVDDMQIYK